MSPVVQSTSPVHKSSPPIEHPQLSRLRLDLFVHEHRPQVGYPFYVVKGHSVMKHILEEVYICTGKVFSIMKYYGD